MRRRYAGSVQRELDERYDAWVKSGKAPAAASFDIDLADRIGSTGTEQKAHNSHTGVIFKIDLQSMKQYNKKTNFARAVKREEVSPEVEGVGSSNDGGIVGTIGNLFGQVAQPGAPDVDTMLAKIMSEFGLEGSIDEVAVSAAGMVGLPVQQHGYDSTTLLRQVYAQVFGTEPNNQSAGQARPSVAALTNAQKLKMRSSLGDKGAMPADLEKSKDAKLICCKGQLLQTSKTRPDGWSFGSVVYDPAGSRPPIDIDGLSVSAGWFPVAATDLPTAEQMAALQKLMGGGAADALKVPPTWGNVKDPLKAELVTLDAGSSEFQQAKSAFMKTLQRTNIKVHSVERVQNTSMWQSYAVKRQTIVQRDKEALGATTTSRFERIWLFHGTDEDVRNGWRLHRTHFELTYSLCGLPYDTPI